MEQFISRSFVVLVFLLIISPVVRYLSVPIETVDPRENRRLADFPNPQSITDLPPELSAYVNDHFGFRSDLITFRREVDENVFNYSASPDFLAGTNNWQFYLGNSTLDDLRHESGLSPQQLIDFRNTVRQRGEALNAKGILYVFVVVPDKSSVYPEYLPRGTVNPHGGSRLKGIETALASDPAAARHFLSLLPALKSAKTNHHDLYYKADTHWNFRGAYVGYRAVIEKLNELKKDKTLLNKPEEGDLPLLAISDDSFVPVSKHSYYGEANITEEKPDEFVRSTSIDEKSSQRIYCKTFISRAWQNIFDGLEGWKNPYTIYNERASTKETLLIFGDSFSDNLAVYLPETFQRVIYAGIQPENDLIAEMVNRYHPDVVMEERVERYLSPILQTCFADAQVKPLELTSYSFNDDPKDVDLGLLSTGQWSLNKDASGHEALRESGSDQSIPVLESNAECGFVDGITQPTDLTDKVTLKGWGVSPITHRPFDAVMVTLGSNPIAFDQLVNDRPDVVSHLGNPSCLKSGFQLNIPFRLLCHPGALRVFGLTGGNDSRDYRLQQLQVAVILPAPIRVASLELSTKASGIYLDKDPAF